MPPAPGRDQEQDLPPATGRRRGHDTTAPPSTAVPPIRVYKEQDLPPATSRRRGHDTPAPPSPAVPPRVYQRRKNLKPAEEEEAEEMMPPAPGGGQQDHPPATTRQRDQDTTPPFPAVVLKVDQRRKKLRQLKEQQAAASIPEGPLIEILSPQARKKLRGKLRQLKARQAAASIPEGPLINILSRLPYRSLRRFRCVSRLWRALCSDPKIRKRSPDSLSGFFHYQRHNKKFRFLNLSGRGPPTVERALPFLRGSYKGFTVEQCCNGLLLCKCWKSDADRDNCDLVVCNPATENWTVLPALLDEEDGEPVYFGPVDAFLAFDTAIHARFVVLVTLRACLDDVAIYSSENGQWMRGGLEDRVAVTNKCVFMNGCMHFSRIDEPHIVAFDIEGKYWNTIPLREDTEEPRYSDTSMGLSQGLLHSWYTDPEEDYLYVWVLEDYENEVWKLKHRVDIVELFGMEREAEYCEMFAIHPERNVIYITNGKDRTVSYNMDNKEVNAICTSGEFLDGLPYVPCLGDWLSDGQ